MSKGRQDTIECVIADDHGAIRMWLAALFGNQPDLRVTGQAAEGEETLRTIIDARPHVAVVDLRMPGLSAIDVCRRAASAAPGTAIVVHTGIDDPEAIDAALGAGARGVVLKTSPTEDILRAVRLVAGGGSYIDPTLSAALLRRRDGTGRVTLSPREREVLQLIAEGRTTDAAAWSLNLASTTVRSYVDSAVQKLECRNRTEAVAKALRLDLID